MPSTSHRARSWPVDRLWPALGAALVVVLVATGFVVARSHGNTVVADPAPGSSLVVAPSTALDTATDASAATDDPSATDTPSASDPPTSDMNASVEALPGLTTRAVELKVDARRAALRDRVEEAAQLARDQARDQARERARVRARAERRTLARTAPFDVRIGTFNVLGSQHTAPGGERRNFPPASVRSPQQAAYISDRGLEIVGMQEFQTDQLNLITARTGLTAWPGYAWGAQETDNSILYDADRFEMVSGDVFTIPFMGRPRPQPILRLRVRETGREFYVVNTHPSAGHTGRYAVERHRGQDVLLSVLAGLRATGLPVLITGDMNDREVFYDRVVCRGGLVSASGGSGCQSRPPQMYAVDWVVGTPAVTFSDYVSDGGPQDRRLTDHYVVHATAHVG